MMNNLVPKCAIRNICTTCSPVINFIPPREGAGCREDKSILWSQIAVGSNLKYHLLLAACVTSLSLSFLIYKVGMMLGHYCNL